MPGHKRDIRAYRNQLNSKVHTYRLYKLHTKESSTKKTHELIPPKTNILSQTTNKAHSRAKI